MLVGGFNTAASYALYLALLWLIPIPEAAYTGTWIAAIAWLYFLNAKFTFRARRSARKFALFLLAYLAQYVVGFALLEARAVDRNPARFGAVAGPDCDRADAFFADAPNFAAA